ncbi:MAG: hypothetical protein Q7S19_00635 [bacterium]|nr:hypothetical protein [bacterium]
MSRKYPEGVPVPELSSIVSPDFGQEEVHWVDRGNWLVRFAKWRLFDLFFLVFLIPMALYVDLYWLFTGGPPFNGLDPILLMGEPTIFARLLLIIYLPVNWSLQLLCRFFWQKTWDANFKVVSKSKKE